MNESQAPGHEGDPVIRPSRGAPIFIDVGEQVVIMGGSFTMWETRQAWQASLNPGEGEIVPPPLAEGVCVVAMRLSSDGMSTEYGAPLVIQESDWVPWNSRWGGCSMEDGQAAFAYTGEGEIRLRMMQVDRDSLSISTLQDFPLVVDETYPEWADEMPWGDEPWVAIGQGTLGVAHLGAGMVVISTELEAYLPGSRFPVHPDYPPEQNTEWVPIMIPVWKSETGWEPGPYQILYVPPAYVQGRDRRYEDLHVLDPRTVCLTFAGEGGAGIAVVAKADRSTRTLTVGPRNKFCWGVSDWFLLHQLNEFDFNEPGAYVVEREGIDVSYSDGSSCLVRGGILAVGNGPYNQGALGFPHWPVTTMRLLKVRGFRVDKVDVRPIGEWASYRCAPLAGGRAIVSRDMPPHAGNPYAGTLPGWTDGMGGYAEVVEVIDNRLKVLFGLGQGMSCMQDGPGPL